MNRRPKPVFPLPGLNPWRRQLPAHSPLSLRDVLGAATDLLRHDGDARSRLAALLGERYRATQIFLFGSGTDALHQAIRLAAHGRLVALPAFTCFAVVAAAAAADARVTLYDVEPDTLAPDLDSLDRALHNGAGVVVVTPLFGVPIAWEPIAERAASHGALLIEDAAQGHGAAWRGGLLGSFGQLSVLSFGRGKGWTGVRGGALLLRAPSVSSDDARGAAPISFPAEAVVLALAAGMWLLARPAVYGLPASVPALELGHDVRRPAGQVTEMPRAAAALVRRTLASAEAAAATRRGNGATLTKLIMPRPHAAPIRAPLEGTCGFLRFPIRLSRGLGGFQSPQAALREGIVPAYGYTLGDLREARERMAGKRQPSPGAEELARTLVTLPTHQKVLPPRLQAVAQLVNTYEP